MTDITKLSDGTELKAGTVRVLCIDGPGDKPTGEASGRIGGSARLPVGMEMPALESLEAGRETLTHLATFPAAMLDHVAPGLPAGDIVLLFASDTQPWGFVDTSVPIYEAVKSIRDGHRVVFIPAGTETVEVEGGETHAERTLVVREHQELDLVDQDDFDRISIEVCEEWDDLNDALSADPIGDLYPAIRVAGKVQPIQGDMVDELPDLAKATYSIDTTPEDWVRIAEVATLDEPGGVQDGWMWGDCGVLYYWMTKADLAEARFDRTICILQCM